MLALVALIALVVTPLAGAGAQVPTRPDTTRRPAPRDTARRPAADTVRRDSVRTVVPVPQRPDSARSDSVRGIPDSTRTKTRADSIQSPVASAELPPDVRVGRVLRWTRDSIFASGALTLTDLLERVPGITTYRSGWLAAAHTAAYMGDFRRVRIFRDGVEMDAINPRNGGIPDLVDLQLWQADEITIERTAAEVRVHIRTWSTRNTTAYTRVDISTGDEDTNLYRGFYGKRWGNGVALQIGAQQYGTGTRNRLGGGGDALNAMTRLGWARGKWSVDGLYIRLDRTRDLTLTIEQDSLLRSLDARRNDAYLRAAYGDTERGPWAQLIASTLGVRLENTAVRDTTGESELDSIPLPAITASRAQYVAAFGFTRGRTRASVYDRMRVGTHTTTHAPSLRLSWDAPIGGAAGYVERTGADSTTRAEVTGRFSPFPWLTLQGSASRLSRDLADTTTTTRTNLQAEAAVRFRNAWFTGGVVRRGQAELADPLIYDLGEPPPGLETTATGLTIGAQGKVYRDVYLDLNAVSWGSSGLYRPQYQARVELGIATNWLGRFPSGNLGIHAALIDEYRSRAQFRLEVGEGGGVGWLAEQCTVTGSRCAAPSNSLGALLEIRIQKGTLWYQLRNALNRTYEQVPGFVMPRPISVYGVRWEFWN